MPPSDRDLIAAARGLLATATASPWWTSPVGIFAGDGGSDSPLVAEDVNRADAELISWMRNNLPEILKRWESDGRDWRALDQLVGAIMRELDITNGDDESILPRIQKLKAANEIRSACNPRGELDG